MGRRAFPAARTWSDLPVSLGTVWRKAEVGEGGSYSPLTGSGVMGAKTCIRASWEPDNQLQVKEGLAQRMSGTE
jgi:hypothetical protein